MAVLTAAAIVVGPLAAMALARAARRATAGTHARGLVAERRWRLPARPRAWCVRRLGDADVALEPEAACELWLGASAAATILGAGIARGLAAPVALVALGAGPAGLWAARGRATRRFVTTLPSALEQVAVAMRSGASASEAIGMIADGDGPIADDLRRVRARADLGLGLTNALATWPTERALPSVRAAAGALALASTVGGGAADALDGLAVSLRERSGAVAEAKALSAQARVSAVVVGAGPLGYLALSALVDPSSFDTLAGTAPGRTCLAIGLMLDGAALLWMRRIVRVGDAE